MKILACILIFILSSQSSAEIFTVQPKDQLIPASSSAKISFSCDANLPNPVYSWKKDDVDLDTSDETKFLATGGTLQIKKPAATDAGLYQCIATSGGDVAASNYGQLTFAYNNPFTKEARGNIPTLVGKGVAIPCLGANFAPQKSVFYYWTIDEPFAIVNAPGDSRRYISQKDGTLYLSNAKLSDSNTLTCTAASVWKDASGNRVKQESSPVQLVVSDAVVKVEPEFLLKPSDVVGMLGKKVLLECFAQGNPIPNITWFKEEGKLPVNHTITPAGQLLLPNITEDMTGTYVCQASNSEGTIEGSSTLSLQYAPQWIREISSISGDLSSSITLRCQAIASPAASYSWLKNAQPLNASEEVSITSDGPENQLQISNLSEEDEAMYQCVASNSHGTVFSNAKITVQSYPPEFKTGISDVTKALIGREAKIRVEISSSPPAKISWKKDEVGLSMDGITYSMEPSGTLIIYNVTESNKGSYTCRAENILGEIFGDSYLDVYKPTIITQSPEDAELVAGDAKELHCMAQHDSELTMTWQWKQDENEIQYSDPHYQLSQSSLLLLDVTSEQTGTYHCCAATEVEVVCSDALVVVTAPPNQPSDVKVMSSAKTSQRLSWTVPGNNQANITQYHVMGKNNFQSQWFVMATNPPVVTSPPCYVIDLLPNNVYEYKISAENKIGVGEKSEPSVGASTLQGAPSKAPSGVSGGGGVQGQLVVTWEPLPITYYGTSDVDYYVGVQKLGVGVPVPLIIDPSNPNASLPDSGQPWRYTTVFGGSSSQAIFEVDESEIFVAYQARVRATNEVGNGPNSPLRLIFTAELAPTTTPVWLGTVWTLAYSAMLHWKPLNDTNGFTKGYHVRVCSVIDTADSVKCPSAAAHWINATTPNAKPEVLVEGLKPNYAYKVSIAGFNTGGLGPWSNWDDAMFAAAKAPPNVAPSGVKIKVNGQKLTARWDQVVTLEPILGYKIQYWLANETSANLSEKATGDTSVDLVLPYKADYYVWIRAYNEGGDGKPVEPYLVSTFGGTKLKYEGNGAALPQKSFTTMLSIAILWSFVCALM